MEHAGASDPPMHSHLTRGALGHVPATLKTAGHSECGALTEQAGTSYHTLLAHLVGMALEHVQQVA